MDGVAVTRVIEVDVKASASANQHIKDIADKLGGIEDAAKSTKKGMTDFFDNVGSAAKGFIGFLAADKIRGFVMELNRLNDESKILFERMKLVTGSSQAAGDALGEVTRIAREQGREIDGTAKLYEKAARNAEALGITSKGVSVLTEGFAASLRLSGTSTQEANAALIQFGQVLASGKFQGDEFRSMMENNSVFMYELAKASNVTMSGLRKMSTEGKLDAEFLREALFKMGADGQNALERMMENAGKLPKTFDQAINGVKASLTELLAAINQIAGHAEGLFTRIAKAVGNGVSAMAQRIREETIISNAQLTAMGKQLPQEQTPVQQRMDEDIKLSDRRIATVAELDRVKAKAAALEANGLTKETNRDVAMAYESMSRLRGTIRGLDQVLEERQRKEEKLGDNAPMLTTGWKATKDDKKKKGGHQARDILGDMMDDLDAAELKLENKIDHMGKMGIKVEEALREFATKGGKEYSTEVMQHMIRTMRAKANEIDSAASSLGIQEFIEKRFKDELKKAEVSGQKEIDQFVSRMKHFTNAAQRLNPLFDIEQETDEVKGLLGNPATTEKQKAMLVQYLDDLRLKMAEKLLGVKDVVKDVGGQMADEWEKSFDRMTGDLLSFSKSNKEILTNFVTDMLRELARIELKQAYAPLVEAGKSAIKGFDWSSLFASANGSVWSNGARMFAKGGVVDKPTGFEYGGGHAGVMGEAGAEAIMPLRRGADGKLGVGSTPVTVNVINNTSGKVSTSETTNSKGEREISVMIQEVMEGAIGSGRMDKVMGNSFNISRKGK